VNIGKRLNASLAYIRPHSKALPSNAISGNSFFFIAELILPSLFSTIPARGAAKPPGEIES
jgi:hypothetical protein